MIKSWGISGNRGEKLPSTPIFKKGENQEKARN